MSTARVPFSQQEMGYSQNQVDRYIEKLTSEYGNLQQKYNELSAQSEQKDLPSEDSMRAIAKALVDAEIKGIQIISEAKGEAARIIGNAYEELEQVKEAKDRTFLEIKELMNGLKDIMPVNNIFHESVPFAESRVFSDKKPIPEPEDPPVRVYSEKDVFPDRRIFPEPEFTHADA